MQSNGVSKKRDLSLPDWSYVISGLDPAISPAKGIPASERGNDIVSYKSKLGLLVRMSGFTAHAHAHAHAHHHKSIPTLSPNMP